MVKGGKKKKAGDGKGKKRETWKKEKNQSNLKRSPPKKEGDKGGQDP